MDWAEQISRLQTSARALLIETHCIAREPVERWPISLRLVKPPTDNDIEGTVEAVFERYRAVAISSWNLISKLQRLHGPGTLEATQLVKTPVKSIWAVEDQERNNRENQDEELLVSFESVLSSTLARLRTEKPTFRSRIVSNDHDTLFGVSFDTSFDTLKELTSRLSDCGSTQSSIDLAIAENKRVRITDHEEVVQRLEFECGEETAFLFAAEFGMEETIKRILKNRPTVIYAVNRQKSTALHHATQRGSRNIAVLLAAGADPLARDYQGLTPLHHAVDIRAFSLFMRNIEGAQKTGNGIATFDEALLEIQPELMRRVIEDVDSDDIDGWGKAGFLSKLRRGDWPVVKAFLIGGFNPDALFNRHHHTFNGYPSMTALQIAVLDRSTGIARLLLDAGVDPDMKSGDGSTALHYAVRTGSIDVTKAMCSASADPNIRNVNGQTALHWATYYLTLDILLRLKVDVDVQDNHGSTALHLALASSFPNSRVAKLLLAANANLFIRDNAGNTPFDVGARSGNSEIATMFARRLLSQSFESLNEKEGVSFQMFIKSPVTLTKSPSLCQALVNSVDQFYCLLDKFENPVGFALGFDILREDMVLANPLDSPCFTGRREMLWIEYDSISPSDLPAVKNVLESIATIISPFPVAAYDTQEFGIGLLVHDGFYPGYDDESSSTSSNLSSNISPSSWVEVNPEIDLIPLEIEMEDLVFTSPAGNVTANTSAADNDVDNNHNNPSNNDSRDGTNIDAPGNGNINGGGRLSGNPRTGGGGFGAGNGEEEDEDDHESPPTPPADPSVVSELYLPSNTFTGRTRLNFGSSCMQELSVSFDLRITPSPKDGKINCAILIDDFVVRASERNSDITTVQMNARYVTDRITLTIRPSGPYRPPVNVFPLLPYFTEKQTISVNQQCRATFPGSAFPSISLQGSRAKGNSVDRRPVTIAVEPVDIRPGIESDSQVWIYRTHSAGEGHLEFSSKHPPKHKIDYRVSPNSRMPDNFKVKVEVIYHCKRIHRRENKSNLLSIFRFLKEVNAKDILMSLEVTIDEEQSDNFLFPAINKEGCDLDMELNFVGNNGQGVPITGGRGCVKSQLNTATKCA